MDELIIPNPPSIPRAELEAALTADPAALTEVLPGDDRPMRERVIAAWGLGVDHYPEEFVRARALLRQPRNYGGGGHSTDWRADWNTLWPKRLPTVSEWIAFTCHHLNNGVWTGDQKYRDLAFRVRLTASPPFFPVKPALESYGERAKGEWWADLHRNMVQAGMKPGFDLQDVAREFPSLGEEKAQRAMDIRAIANGISHRITWDKMHVTLVTPEGADAAELSWEEGKALEDGTLVRGPFTFGGSRDTVRQVAGAKFGDVA